MASAADEHIDGARELLEHSNVRGKVMHFVSYANSSVARPKRFAGCRHRIGRSKIAVLRGKNESRIRDWRSARHSN